MPTLLEMYLTGQSSNPEPPGEGTLVLSSDGTDRRKLRREMVFWVFVIFIGGAAFGYWAARRLGAMGNGQVGGGEENSE